MAQLFADFQEAQRIGSGHLLATCLLPVDPPHDPHRLRLFAQISNYSTISADVRYHIFQSSAASYRPPKTEANTWVDIFVALWTTVKEILAIEDSQHQAGWGRVFDAYKELTNQLIRGYGNGFQAWTVPCLYTTGKFLRSFAIKADAEAKAKDEGSFKSSFSDDIMVNVGKNERLEQAAWVVNRMFTTCLSDRSEITQSRKWGIYSTTNLLFKCYFRLNSVGLTKNVLRALAAAGDDIPPMKLFPKSHVVTFKYYRGVISFLEENYGEAEEHLTEAWQMCHRDARRNRDLILTYLIPCHLLTTHTLPTTSLLASSPRLEALFRPLCSCIKGGDLSGFDAALASGEHEFVRRRIYLTLERGRDIALRNLFRLVFLAGGFDEAKDGQAPIRRTRIPVAEFAAAIRLGSNIRGSSRVDLDEVECLLANLIYKNLMKGYIARDRGVVVLSKGGAFPGTGV